MNEVRGCYVIGEWQLTPAIMRLMGWPKYRRYVELRSYHVFSEWEYSMTIPSNEIEAGI